MKIKETLTKVPGGMMLFPLLIGAIIRTFFPHLFDQTVFKTSFTGGLLTGTAVLLAAFYVCLGGYSCCNCYGDLNTAHYGLVCQTRFG
jgi:2-keto-3-deoxygluconate permease